MKKTTATLLPGLYFKDIILIINDKRGSSEIKKR